MLYLFAATRLLLRGNCNAAGQRPSYSPHSGSRGLARHPMIPGMSIYGVAHPPGRHEEPAGCNRASSGHRPQRRVGAGAEPPEQGLRMKEAAQLRACFAET
ncbi:hypothetical protein NDU88_000868 [Pleurodeles waltl]|uniref:Secreted protein n=1 Tax=Pleurodeles waltl TaxID=8319 RepID=A0AAV7UVB2_PLEWA|nr:hypothetical protein NDU88_000868 [Pleurodeles waltl]